MVRKGTRSNEEMRRDVYSRLSWDGRVNEENIVVEGSDGKIVLTGTVPAYPDLWEAEEDAYAVSGVSYVDNRLEVRLPPSSRAHGDADIDSRLESLLRWSPSLDPEEIDIRVEHGLVILMGKVGSIRQKYDAGHLAGHVAGVTGVRNLLKVEPVKRVPDPELRRIILESLDGNALIDADMVNVHAKKGIVTLSGTVPDYHVYRTAEEIARYTDGVIDVNNNLIIS